MRVIIVGNGLAGTIVAKTIREMDRKVLIDIFAEERFPYYPRPNLIGFLEGRIEFEKMFAFPEEWYSEQNINVHLAEPVTRIIPGLNQIETEEGNREKYDFLILASGSQPFVPAIKGLDKSGVFTLRNLDNAFELMAYIGDDRRVTVLGGGLLGLETARALKWRGVNVEVVEFFSHLLPRQLDRQGASVLKSQIEKIGIKVSLGLACEEVLGQTKVTGLRFKGGQEIKTDVALVAAGVRPNIRIAQAAGLEVDRGLVVNDYLQTSVPDILAAGDVIQHAGRVYGIIPASFNQARAVAQNIMGQIKKYEGTVPSNTLKVVGIELTSIGVVHPEDKSCEEFRKEDQKHGIYKKIVVRNGVICGFICIGTKKNVREISQLISQKVNVDKWKESLLDDDFDFSVL